MSDVRYVDNDGVQIAYSLRDQREDAPWLVLIHGLGYGHWGWEPVEELLADEFRLVLVDNRGVGESDAPEGPYSVSEMTGDVLAVLDDVEIESTHIVGASLGGMVALEFALRHPERVDRLVLVGTMPGGDDSYPFPEEMQELMQEIAELEDEAALRKTVRHALTEDTAAIKPHLIERILHYRLVEHPQREAAWQAQAAAATQYEAASRLDEISVPTLIVQAEEDQVVDPRNAELMADRIPDAQLCRIEGAGHLVFWEKPRPFAEALLRFLSDDASEDDSGARGASATDGPEDRDQDGGKDAAEDRDTEDRGRDDSTEEETTGASASN